MIQPKKLKLYTDWDLLNSPYEKIQLLVPFLGQDKDEKNPDFNMLTGRFNKYEASGKDYFEFTSLEACDACILPIHYMQDKDNSQFEAFIAPFTKKVADSGKRTIVFVGSDIDQLNVVIPNALIFHNTLYQSKRDKNHFSYTFFFEDLMEKYYNGNLPLRRKQQEPVIGFCGFAPPLGLPAKWTKFKIKETLRLYANYVGIIKRYPSYSAHSYRARALKGLLKSKIIKTNFIIREKFAFGGPYGNLNPGGTRELNAVFRENYVKNMVESDYVLCVRGIGNNSIRFFEALCCGRIPVFLDTDCVLPFDFEIDWKKYCLIIAEKDIDNIDQILAKYHSSLSERRFHK